MGALATILASSLTFSCGTLMESVPADYSYEAPALKNDWSFHLCHELTSTYDDVELKRISERHKKASKDADKAHGRFVIEDIRAGRTKMVWQSEKKEATTEIWVAVKAKKEVWVFRNNLSSGTKIKKRHTSKKKVNVAHLLGVHDLPSERPVGMITTKRVGKDTVITSDLISEPPLIKRKEKIKVVIEVGALRITSDGVALETGWKLGDTISVKVENSEEPVKAIVRGEKLVDVEF